MQNSSFSIKTIHHCYKYKPAARCVVRCGHTHLLRGMYTIEQNNSGKLTDCATYITILAGLILAGLIFEYAMTQRTSHFPIWCVANPASFSLFAMQDMLRGTPA